MVCKMKRLTFSYRRPIYVVTSNSPTVCWCSCRVWRRCGVQRILMNPNVCVSECTLPDTLNSWFLVAQLHVWWVAQTHPLSYQFIRYTCTAGFIQSANQMVCLLLWGICVLIGVSSKGSRGPCRPRCLCGCCSSVHLLAQSCVMWCIFALTVIFLHMLCNIKRPL